MAIQNKRTAQSALVLANAGEIVSGVIREISGNDISNSLNGSKVTSDLIHSLVYQRITKNVEAKLRQTL